MAESLYDFTYLHRLKAEVRLLEREIRRQAAAPTSEPVVKPRAGRQPRFYGESTPVVVEVIREHGDRAPIRRSKQ